MLWVRQSVVQDICMSGSGATGRGHVQACAAGRTSDGDGEGLPLHLCSHEAHHLSKPHIPLEAV